MVVAANTKSPATHADKTNKAESGDEERGRDSLCFGPTLRTRGREGVNDVYKSH